jgi:hypothetical protein
VFSSSSQGSYGSASLPLARRFKPFARLFFLSRLTPRHRKMEIEFQRTRNGILQLKRYNLPFREDKISSAQLKKFSAAVFAQRDYDLDQFLMKNTPEFLDPEKMVRSLKPKYLHEYNQLAND